MAQQDNSTGRKQRPGPSKNRAPVVLSFEDLRPHLHKMKDEILEVLQPTPATPLIFSAINGIMAAIAPLAKEHRHDDQDFWFRKIDEICDTLQPLLVEHKVIAVPEVLRRWRTEHPVITMDGHRYVQFFTTVKTRWHLYCTLDGSHFPFPCVTMGEGMSDMHFSTNAAGTMAFKQMLVQVFCIPVSGLDPEEVSGERVQTSYQIPESTNAQPHAEPGERSLFDEDFTPPDYTPAEQDQSDGRAKRGGRGSRREKEPREAVAGAGVKQTTLDEVLNQSPATTQGAAITPGFMKIIQSTLKTKAMEESILLAHLEVTTIEEIRTDQMDAAMAFINNGGGNGNH